MSFRRTGKLLTLVGFVICLSLSGILYGNLNTVTEERDHILSKKNAIKLEIDEHKSTIGSLEVRVSRLESSLNSCNAAKLETEERNSLLQNDEDSLKLEAAQHKSALESMRYSKEQEILQLKGQVSEQSGREEAAEACTASNDVLQQQLSFTLHRVSVKEGELTSCIKEKNSLLESIQSGDTKEAAPKEDDSNGHINPVAAVPVPENVANVKSEVKSDDHVADIPDIPQNNAVIDNKQEIPGAQAPAPQPVADKPVIEGHVAEAIGVPPQLVERHDGMGELQPLQPVPMDVLAKTLEEVKEEEQLQQLQERQDRLVNAQPPPAGAGAGVGAGDTVNNIERGEVQEIQPAQPAPIGLIEREENNNIDNEIQGVNLGIHQPNIAL